MALSFYSAMSGPITSRRESWILAAIFCAALLIHFYGATISWTVPFMSGHEFRQAQTAIVSHYIDRQNNFSLLYETPILGKPWVSILLEVPIYEWSVVLLSRATGLPHYMAARTISLASFYLTLPALYLLLGRLALPRPRRLLVLALILVCPVYIYYSRAFLIDPMELMCCAWFLLGFVRTMDERRWAWLGLTVVAGTGAALIKSAMFVVWLLPAAGYGAWMLWRDLRAGKGWRPPLQTLLWGLATVVVAFGLLRWWLAYTDPIKAAHPSAWIFTSDNLSLGNWGLFNFKVIFSDGIWRQLLDGWRQAIMPAWLIIPGLAAGLAFLQPVRWRIAGMAAVFFLIQAMMPFAYAYQDYYFYSCAIFLLTAFGLMAHGLLDSRLPRWICWLLIMVPLAALLTTYWNGYRPAQSTVSPGSTPFTDALRDLTPENSVILIAGADWAAMTPLYARRKALMIRNGLEYDPAYLDRAFADLADEDVSALVLYGNLRTNRPFIDRVGKHFDFDVTAPTFSHPAVDVYLRRLYSKGALMRLRGSLKYPDVKSPENAVDQAPSGPFLIDPPVARTAFANFTPGPFKARFGFGFDLPEHEGERVLSTHPDSDLWLRPAAGASRIIWEFGLFPPAYEKSGDKSDGVEFLIEGETPDGQRRQVYRRVLDPVRQEADRGRQHVDIPYAPREGETLHFATRPNFNFAYDWCYWARIEVK